MSRIIAVALTLVILAVPAFAQEHDTDLASPYPQDLKVKIDVAPIAEFYHAGNADELELSVFDAKHTFGKTLSMRFGGNCPFNIALAVQAQNNELPDDVRFELVTVVDKAAWEGAATDIGDGLWRYNNTAGNLGGFIDTNADQEGRYWQLGNGETGTEFANLATSIERTPIWSYTGLQEYTTLYNLFTVYAGHGMPAQKTEASVLVEFYLSPGS